MYHGTDIICTSIYKRLPDGTPFHQGRAGAGDGIVVVVGADAQGVAEAAGAFRHDVPGEKGRPVPLLHEGQHNDLGLFQVPVGIDAADDHLGADIGGAETREIDGGTHRDGLAADQRTTGSGPGIDKADAVPDLADFGVPASFFAAEGIVRLAHAQVNGVGRLVQLGHVLVDHTAAIEGGGDVGERLLDAAHPLAGGLFAAFVEHGDDFVFQQRVEGGGVEGVLIVAVDLAFSDGPAAGSFVGFVEPAVEDAEIEHAVDGGFHAAGAASLFAAAGIVEPDIDALHEFARDFHIVVFHEDYVLPEFGIARELDHLADVGLARLIFGMRLAGDYDLHRHVGIQQDALEALDVAEEQGGALIGGKAAGEADGKRVGIEDLGTAPHFERGRLPADGRRVLAGPHEGNQTPLAPAVHFEQFLIWNLLDLCPDGGIVEALAPVGIQVLIVEQRQVAVEPARQVHAVGDGGDGHLPQREIGPQVVEHLLGDLAVQTADGVAVGGGAERQYGHGEALVAVETVAASEGHELLEIDADFGAVLGKVVVHHAGIEQVDARWYRGMGGENVAGAGGFQGLVEIELLVAHVEPDLFQHLSV